jgi:hypothetical protein
MTDKEYKVGTIITWFLIFIGSYIYCIAAYGFLLGVGLGWLPSLIVASIFCWFWPLYALILLVGGAYLYQRSLGLTDMCPLPHSN